MNKVVGGWIMSFLGSLLLVTGLLLVTMGPGLFERVPLNTKNTTRLSGEVEKLGESAEVKATSITSVDAKKSDGDDMVWVNVSCVMKAESDTECGEEGTGDDVDPDIVTIGTDVFATNRHTGESVKFPGTIPEGSVQKSGLVNKWPFDTAKKTYRYWDDLLGATVPVKYVGESMLKGMKTYKFEYTVDDEPAEIAEGTQGIYSQQQTFYIEPKTGAILQQEQHQVRKLDDGTVALDLKLAFTDKQVAESVSSAKGDVSKLRLIETTLPIVAIILGLGLLVGGFVLQRRRAPDPSA